MNTLIELRAGTGGKDAKNLVENMANVYMKACSIKNFSVKPLQ